MMINNTLLDQYVATLQTLPPWNIHNITPEGQIVPWYDVNAQVLHSIVADLVVRTANLEDQAAAVSAQIFHWGRLEAIAKRVWEAEDRIYRTWRAKKRIEFSTPPDDDSGKDEKKWKKPTETLLEDLYRVDPEYPTVYARVERAEEAYNSTLAVREGFKAKKETITQVFSRYREGG